MADMKFLRQGSRTWEQVWEIIAKRNNGDRSCYDTQTGEEWQYMCTILRDNRTVQHQFRHRSLNGERKYDTVEDNLTDQILNDFQ